MKEREYSFYQWSVSDLERHFEVNSKTGLTHKKALLNIKKYGPNSLESIQEKSLFKILLAQFSNFFIIILLIASVVSYFVDGLFQSLMLLFVVILNVLLGFFQEFKAEKALASLKKRFRIKCKVLREGSLSVIDSELITLGDIVLFEAGDLIPADIRIIESESLRTNESALTGESLPVNKSNIVLPIDTPLADQKNMLFGSTTVVAGRGQGIVVYHGKNTQLGKIAGMVGSAVEETPLEKQILFLGKVLTYISLFIVVILFILGQYRGYEMLPLLTFVIALLVGAVPESLPTIITLALAIGVTKMAKKKAIVRRLSVIEALGTINIIATDKTGTLTNNYLEATSAYTYDGTSIMPIDLKNEGRPDKSALKLLEKIIVCSNIQYKAIDEMIGDPLEIAVAERAKSLHAGALTEAKKYQRKMEIPFDSDKKYMAVLSVDPEGKKNLIVKGAPEKIITFSKLSPRDKDKLRSYVSGLSSQGLRVIAVGSKNISADSFSTISDLNFDGFVGLADEPSKGVKEAIRDTISCGIRPIILTGDHPETAKFIAKEVGLEVNENEIVTGTQLKLLSDTELDKRLTDVKIFARVTPEDKINIVERLQKNGYSVAVTGDGVNDAPAIKKADVGIAMGIKGTDIARESSDVVLSDDKYGTIVNAVMYGRTVYDNIRNAIILLLSANFSELFLVGLAFIFDLPMPLLTLQILWINMVTDSFPALALAFEEPSSKILQKSPRSAKISSMRQPIMYSVYLSFIGFILCLFIFLWGLSYSPDKARTLTFTFAVLLQLGFAFSIRSTERIWQNLKSFLENKFMVISILGAIILQCLIFISPINKIFGVVPLNAKDLTVLLISTLISFFSAELIRWRFDKTKRL